MTLLLLLAVSLLTLTVSAERWSRQISPHLLDSPEVINDWIPLASNQQQYTRQAPAFSSTPEPVVSEQPEHPQSVDRSGNARVLTYPQNVFGTNLQAAGAQQSPPAFNFVHPFQFPRFQQNQKAQTYETQQPTSQSFFKFEMPSFSIDGNRHPAQPIQTGYQIQHTFGPAAPHSVATSPLFSQKQVFPPEFHPIQSHNPQHQQLVQRTPPQQQQQQQQQQQHFEKKTKDSKPTPAQDNFVAHRPDAYGAQPQTFQIQKPTTFQSQFPNNDYRQQEAPVNNYNVQEPAPVRSSQEEEVQLLYVPYDTLYSQQNEQQLGFNNAKYNLVQQPVNPLQINNFYTQDPLDNRNVNYFGSPSSTTTTTSTTLRPTTSSTTYRAVTNVNQFLNPRFSTQKPKPKPHQPPLAMFLQKSSNRASPYDVVNVLSSEKSVSVIDAPTKTAPQVFVGPAGLQTPSGYTKFELPYLSSFDQNSLESNLKATPFFVAPLSYKTPFGFSKIVLPEPHVGSIVINKPFQIDDNSITRGTTRRPSQRPTPTRESYNSPSTLLQNNINNVQTRFPSTTPRQVTRYQTATSPKEDNRYQYTKEQNRVTPTPKDYYSNQYQDAIKEISSPRTHQKPHHKAKPVEPAFTQTVKPYAHFKPMPDTIASDDYFRSKPTVSSTAAPTSLSTTTQSTTKFTTPEPDTTTAQTYFSESFEPSRQTQSTRGQFYDSSTTRPSQDPNVFNHRFQSKPLFDDEYRMKSYFRQQNAFRNRQPSVTSTTPTTRFENIQYTPVSLDYDHPSSTPNYYEGSTLRTTTPKERFTFYHPSSGQSFEENIQTNTLPTQHEENQQSHLENQSPEPEIQTPRPTSERVRPTYATRIPTTHDTHIPANHRPTYDNEVTIYNHDDNTKSQEIQFDPSPYDLPSELPPLTPNLPGLVNALKENERLNAIDKETTESDATTATTPSITRPTRRPVNNRGRRPTARTSTSSSVSYSSSDDGTTKRPVNRVRRPYSPRNTTSVTSSISSSSTSATRSSSIRNPNRVRYNPTPEERKQFRTRTRGQLSTLTIKKTKENGRDEDNIDYQRDVLKQNYPVFKHPTRKPYFTTTTDKPSDVVTVTPGAIGEPFPGLLEPMQIAQQYQQQVQDNYGPGYFPNEEDINPTELSKNEIFTTTPTTTTTLTTTTTESVRDLTKRPAFVRRARPRTTTTESPAVTSGTESSSNERFTIRPRRPDGTLPRKVIKVRARTRKPHPASTTVEPERHEKENYQKVSRFNQDFYNDDYKNNEAYRRSQVRSKFNLEPQESQWSPSLTKTDSFKPLNLKDGSTPIKYENEPDIVTAGPDDEAPKKLDTYEFNVSAGFGPAMNTYGSHIKSETKSSKSSKSKFDKKVEPTFEELLEQVMSDLGREAAAKKEAKVVAGEATKLIEEESSRQLKSKDDKPVQRRGVWKKVRVHQVDGFETAESQNIGTQLYNSIYNDEKINNEKISAEKEPQIESNENIDDLANGMKDMLLATTSTTSTTTTTEKPSESPRSVEIISSSTILPDVLATETEAPATVAPKVETITSISEEINSQPKTVAPQNNHDEVIISSTTSSLVTEPDSTTTRFYNQEDYEEDETSIGDTDNITRRFDEKQTDDAAVDDDLETQPSLFDEVRSQLKDLFAAEEDDEEEYSDVIKPSFQPRKHEYTSIQRIRAFTEIPTTDKPEVTTSKDSSFHKNLMKNVVFATSTSTEVSHETEICYRGRCVKSNKNK